MGICGYRETLAFCLITSRSWGHFDTSLSAGVPLAGDREESNMAVGLASSTLTG